GDDGLLASSPTATSWTPGRLDVFVQGIDGLLYQRFWNINSWNNAWLPRGGPYVGAAFDRPAAATWGQGRMDLFVRGIDNRLWQTFYSGTGWSGWFAPPGTEEGRLGSAPSASPWGIGLPGQGNKLTVFTRGTDGHLYQTTWDGGWAG